MMKRIVCLLLSLVLAAACVGCAVVPAEPETRPAEPETRPAEEILAQEKAVREVLSDAALTKTAACVCVKAPLPEHTEYLLSRREASVSYPLVKLCSELESNPIAAFFALKDQGLYRLDYECEDYLLEYIDYDEYAMLCELEEQPGIEVLKCYQSGRDEEVFLRDVLERSAQIEDGVDLEKLILAATENLTRPALSESSEDKVSYAYYVYSTDLFANVLCVYIHHDEAQEQIEDVEFQLLTLLYCTNRNDAEYEEENFVPYFSSFLQMTSLIDAIEMNLTGTSIFHQESALYWKTMTGGSFDIPTNYTIGAYDVSIEQQHYYTDKIGTRGDGIGYETAMLTNYRIRK